MLDDVTGWGRSDVDCDSLHRLFHPLHSPLLPAETGAGSPHHIPGKKPYYNTPSWAFGAYDISYYELERPNPHIREDKSVKIHTKLRRAKLGIVCIIFLHLGSFAPKVFLALRK